MHSLACLFFFMRHHSHMHILSSFLCAGCRLCTHARSFFARCHSPMHILSLLFCAPDVGYVHMLVLFARCHSPAHILSLFCAPAVAPFGRNTPPGSGYGCQSRHTPARNAPAMAAKAAIRLREMLRLWLPAAIRLREKLRLWRQSRHTPAQTALCARRLPSRAAALRAYAQPPRFGTFGAIRAATPAPPLRAARLFQTQHIPIPPLKRAIPTPQRTKNAPAQKPGHRGVALAIRRERGIRRREINHVSVQFASLSTSLLHVIPVLQLDCCKHFLHASLLKSAPDPFQPVPFFRQTRFPSVLQVV